MVSAGNHEIHEGPAVGIDPVIQCLLRLELVVCPACGHVEFFVPGVRAGAQPSDVQDPAPPQEVVADRAAVLNDQGLMEETWVCSCGEVNFVSDEKCLGCGEARS